MRREYIRVTSRATAKRRAPWAATICRVHGGFLAFESVTDWSVWSMCQ